MVGATGFEPATSWTPYGKRVFLANFISAWFSVCYVAIIYLTIGYNSFLILVIPVESGWLRWSWLRFDYNLTTVKCIILTVDISYSRELSGKFNWISIIRGICENPKNNLNGIDSIVGSSSTVVEFKNNRYINNQYHKLTLYDLSALKWVTNTKTKDGFLSSTRRNFTWCCTTPLRVLLL